MKILLGVDPCIDEVIQVKTILYQFGAIQTVASCGQRLLYTMILFTFQILYNKTIIR